MSDAEFAEQIEACTLPKDAFNHRNHLRLAWLYLEWYDRTSAEVRMTTTIAAYATSLGKAEKFDRELTLAWMHLVADAREATPAGSFDAFVQAHPELMDKAAAAKAMLR